MEVDIVDSLDLAVGGLEAGTQVFNSPNMVCHVSICPSDQGRRAIRRR